MVPSVRMVSGLGSRRPARIAGDNCAAEVGVGEDRVCQIGGKAAAGEILPGEVPAGHVEPTEDNPAQILCPVAGGAGELAKGETKGWTGPTDNRKICSRDRRIGQIGICHYRPWQ